MSVKDNIDVIKHSLNTDTNLVVVTKTYSPEKIMEAYDLGERVFGENRPQEMLQKYNSMPKDIKWHQIGTLQTNKVKYIAPFVDLIHSIDSPKLLDFVQKEAAKNNRKIDVLFEIFIAEEETKHGWDFYQLLAFVREGALSKYPNINFKGLMSMATFTDDKQQVKREFTTVKTYYDTLKIEIPTFDTLSMGMSGDYEIAMKCGATMVRIGSLIFKN